MIQITLVGPKSDLKGARLCEKMDGNYLVEFLYHIYVVKRFCFMQILFGYEVRRDKREKHLLREYIALIQ